MYHKLIGSLFLLSLVFTQISAETLNFKAGDRAAYIINQKINLVANDVTDNFESKISGQSDQTLHLDIKLLNVGENGFPYDVEVKVKSLASCSTIYDELGHRMVKLDSANFSKVNSVVARILQPLIDYPLNFRVDADFQVTETTGMLAAVYDQLDDLDNDLADYAIFGATPWCYELILTQMFHLAGQDLQLGESYSTRCYPLLAWESEPLNEQEMQIGESSNYSVETIAGTNLIGFWRGNATVSGEKDGEKYLGTVQVKGEVIWDPANSLSQARLLEIDVTEQMNSTFVSASATQFWLPITPSEE